jgi:hypothetical protein
LTHLLPQHSLTHADSTGTTDLRRALFQAPHKDGSSSYAETQSGPHAHPNTGCRRGFSPAPASSPAVLSWFCAGLPCACANILSCLVLFVLSLFSHMPEIIFIPLLQTQGRRWVSSSRGSGGRGAARVFPHLCVRGLGTNEREQTGLYGTGRSQLTGTVAATRFGSVRFGWIGSASAWDSHSLA